MREKEFIRWIRSRSDFDPKSVPVGPGDDMAVVRCGRERILITVDQVLDGVQFRLSQHGPEAVGRKAMARSLSDVAAMAAAPVAAVVAVALPKGMGQDEAEAIYGGLRAAGDAFCCPLVGGDVASWDDPLAVTVTIIARPAGVEPILRSGARPGDAICVTGRFGGAWRSRRHLSFTPRINEAIALAARCDLHAMIDLSDGLAVDLAHLCEASDVGAAIVAEDVPIHDDARTHGPDAPLDAALADGEDYELLFALPADQAERIARDEALPAAVSRIGTISADKALALIREGRRERLQPRGWEHET